MTIDLQAGKWKHRRYTHSNLNQSVQPSATMPGSHIRMKLGDHGKLIRAYSVVGDTNRFTLVLHLTKILEGVTKSTPEAAS